MNRTRNLALVLLCIAWPALGHLLVPAALATASGIGGLAVHHLTVTLTVASVVLLLRALPHHSHRLLTWLIGAWAARLVLRRIHA